MNNLFIPVCIKRHILTYLSHKERYLLTLKNKGWAKWLDQVYLKIENYNELLKSCANGELYNVVTYMNKYNILKDELNECIIIACRYGHELLFRYLYNKLNHNSNHKDGAFIHYLQYVAESGNIDFLNYMLPPGTRIGYEYGELLYGACCSGNEEMIEYIGTLAKGKCINEKQLVMSGLCTSGNIDLIEKYRKKYNFDLNNGVYATFLNEKNKKIYKNTISYLLKNNIDNWDDFFKGACFVGDIELINFAVTKGLKDKKNSFKRGLIIACEKNNLNVVKYLTSLDFSFYNAILLCYKIACEHNYDEISDYLISIEPSLTQENNFLFPY